VAVVLALSAALIVGASDFAVAYAGRRNDPLVVPTAMQIVSVVGIVALALVVPATVVTGGDLGWGALGGLGSGVGFALFFRALALGRMSVVAPSTAVVGALGPALYGVATGEALSATTATGVALGVVAVVLVTLGEEDAATEAPLATVLGLSFGAGLAFGGYFVALSHTSGDAGMWPLVAVRAVSVPTLVVLVLVTRRPWRIARPDRRLVVGAGAAEAVASAFLLLALQEGPLAVVSVLSSLYPVSTVVLAAVVLHERLRPSQRLGVPLALVAVALTALPS